MFANVDPVDRRKIDFFHGLWNQSYSDSLTVTAWTFIKTKMEQKSC